MPRIALLTALLVLAAAAPAGADTFAVDNTGDADLATCSAAPNDCTLRGAIEKSAATDDPDTITLPADRIRIAAPLPFLGGKAVTIRGVSARSSTIDGTGSVGTLLANDAFTNATVQDVRITGAKRTPFTGEAALSGTNRIERVAVVDNDSLGVLGGSGSTIVDSLVARNTGDGVGGVEGQGALRVTNSTVTENTAAPTFPQGDGTLVLGASVVTVAGINEIDHSTVAGNKIGKGGALLTGVNVGSIALVEPELIVRDSVIGGNADGPNCGGPVQSTGHNVDSDGSCRFDRPGDRSAVDPLLAQLTDNGGPTDTIALLEGSPAIDAGDDCPATDQRGLARASGATCDAGALESPFTVPAPPVPTGPPPTTSPGPTGPPATSPADTTAPKLAVAGIGRTVSRRALRKGLKVKVGADEPIAAELALIVKPHRVSVARVADLVLATRSLARGAGTRTVTLKPAHRPAGRRAIPAQLRVVAFDASGNRAVKAIRFTIR